MWQNGPSRTSDPRHKAWRLAVLTRDAWTCRQCGAGARTADHVIPVAEGGAEHDVDNGQALCDRCHKAKTQAEAARGRVRIPRGRRQAEQPPGWG